MAKVSKKNTKNGTNLYEIRIIRKWVYECYEWAKTKGATNKTKANVCEQSLF